MKLSNTGRLFSLQQLSNQLPSHNRPISRLHPACVTLTVSHLTIRFVCLFRLAVRSMFLSSSLILRVVFEDWTYRTETPLYLSGRDIYLRFFKLFAILSKILNACDSVF